MFEKSAMSWGMQRFVIDSTHSFIIGLPALSEVVAERLLSISWIASALLRTTMDCPRTLMCMMSPAIF